MNTLNHFVLSRVTVAGSLLSMAVMLAACGGGAENGAASESPAATGAVEAAQAVEGAVLPRAQPAAWELQDDWATEQTFLASQQAMASRETAKALGSAALTDTRMKWNPGHYIATGRYDKLGIQQILDEIKDLPQVKGLMLRYEWPQLETAKGVYDFTRIERDLGLVQAAGKRLWIILGTKVFTAGGVAVPDYMRTAEYEGGAYKIQIGSADRLGENTAMYNANVRDRLIALTSALGARINRHNALEGLTFSETALGQTVVPLTEAQRTSFYNNLALVDAATKRAFPNTVTMQFINFPRAYMPGLVTSMVSNGVALGGPDILLQDPDLNNYIYPLYDMAKGKVAVGPSVQPDDYLTTVQNGPLNPPKISDLYAFGRNQLGANYMFWTRTFIGTPAAYPQVLDFFKSTAFPKDATGGLISTCPSTYASCVPQL
jgi:hypothetical protein